MPHTLTFRSSVYVRTLLGLVLLSRSAVTMAQQRQEIQACERCPLQVSKIATLGTEYEAPISEDFTVQRLPDGRFVVSSMVARGEMHVFRADGSFLAKVGRTGRGPGEYIWIDRLVATLDRLYVFDPPSRSRTVVTHEFAFLRRDPIPAQVLSAAVIEDSLMVLNMTVPTAERRSFRLHLLSPDGRFLRSFDAASSASGNAGAGAFRHLTAAKEFVYSGHTNAYAIDEWSVQGALRRTLTRAPTWFQPWDGRCCTVHPERPPEPQLRDIRVDRNGLLWVLITIADTKWSHAVQTSRLASIGYEIADRDGFYDTIIEVIDPRSRRLLGSARVNEFIHKFAGDGLIASYREDLRTNHALLDVWQVSVPPR